MKKPVRSHFNVESQYVTAIHDYASSKDHDGVLQVTAVFSDGSVFTDTIERALATIHYKCFEGEIYEIEYRSHKFTDAVYTDYDPLTLAQTKQAVKEWLNNNPEKPKGIYFTIVGG